MWEVVAWVWGGGAAVSFVLIHIEDGWCLTVREHLGTAVLSVLWPIVLLRAAYIGLSNWRA